MTKEETKKEPKNVYKMIASVSKQLSVEGITKANKNLQQGYNFRGIDDVYNALSPIIASVGLVITPRAISREVVERATKNGGALFYTVVLMEYDFISSDDSSKLTVSMYGEAMDSGDKSTNKAMSAAYKYTCMQTFCIPTEGDNDADATTHEVAQKPTIKPDIKPVDDLEMSLLKTGLMDAKSMDELAMAQGNARAAWSRMSPEQKKTLTKEVEIASKRLVQAP
jgi:hypothetical protein